MRIGLTGGIASGKSTVSAMLAELGATIIDADEVAREVVALDTPGLAAIADEFGQGILLPDGTLNRPALGAIVFADSDRLQALEQITHPLIWARMTELEQAVPAGALVIRDNPLLVESGQAPDFDVVIVVDTPVELQRQRMIEQRGMTEQDADARMAAQATREQRLAAATHVIHNDGTLEELRAQVEQLFAELSQGEPS